MPQSAHKGPGEGRDPRAPLRLGVQLFTSGPNVGPGQGGGST